MEIEQLYLDLDGVLADFDRGVEGIFDRRPDELDLSTMWRGLARHDDFFGTLALMEDAQTLWDYCKPYDPIILTGLPRGDWAAPQKRRWVENMLGRHVEVITCMSRDKPRWSGPGRVLVDDRLRAKEPWEARGGLFLHHVTAEQTISQLDQLGI